jgi:tetratricopeptide (TPR) repeat protein
MGLQTMAAAGHGWLVATELSAGDPGSALAALLEADAILAELGDHTRQSTTQATLARVYERLGERDAARTATELADELGGKSDVLNQILTHPVRARLALADGDSVAAERWARSAVDHASRTDMPVYQGNTKLELARVLSALGRRDEAISDARAALKLFQSKGDRPGADEAQALLDELGAGPL